MQIWLNFSRSFSSIIIYYSSLLFHRVRFLSFSTETQAELNEIPFIMYLNQGCWVCWKKTLFCLNLIFINLSDIFFLSNCRSVYFCPIADLSISVHLSVFVNCLFIFICVCVYLSVLDSPLRSLNSWITQGTIVGRLENFRFMPFFWQGGCNFNTSLELHFQLVRWTYFFFAGIRVAVKLVLVGPCASCAGELVIKWAHRLACGQPG